ncbi:MAG: metallophosphoesterase [Candidatus Bathyarchaeia archaeon]
MVRLALTADVHTPKYLPLFRESLQKLTNIDLMLLAGDLVYRNGYERLFELVKTVRDFSKTPLLACFGNEEWESYENKYREVGEITWLDDESLKVNVQGLNIHFIGSRGILDRPTFWQRTHIKDIYWRYESRFLKISRMLREVKGEYVVVMTHYAPTYVTLEGENENVWPEMGCRRMESVIRETRPLVWIHGHAHKSTRLETWVAFTYVLNVSLPARGGIVVLDLEGVKSERLKRAWGP